MMMKKRDRICIFYVVLICLFGTGMIGIYRAGLQGESEVPQQMAEEETETTETEEVLPIMELQEAFSYVMVEEDGYLVVYERDMETVFLETRIPFERFSPQLQEEIAAGKKFRSVEAVYDFLENYSS